MKIGFPFARKAGTPVFRWKAFSPAGGAASVWAVLFLFLVHMAVAPLQAAAERISFPGAQLRPDPLPTVSEGGLGSGADSLFPTKDLSGNIVTVTGGTIPGSVFGGLAADKGNTTGNMVKISNNSNIGFLAIGGYTTQGETSDNTVRIENSTLAEGVIAGMTMNGNASGNKIFFSGASSTIALGAGHTGNGIAQNNSVTFTGGTIIGEGITGGSATTGTVRDNSITVSGGNIQSVGGGAPVFLVPGLIPDIA